MCECTCAYEPLPSRASARSAPRSPRPAAVPPVSVCIIQSLSLAGEEEPEDAVSDVEEVPKSKKKKKAKKSSRESRSSKRQRPIREVSFLFLTNFSCQNAGLVVMIVTQETPSYEHFVRFDIMKNSDAGNSTPRAVTTIACLIVQAITITGDPVSRWA